MNSCLKNRRRDPQPTVVLLSLLVIVSVLVLSHNARATTYNEPPVATAEIVLSRSFRDMTLDGKSLYGSGRVADIVADVTHHAIYLSFTDRRFILVLDLDLSPIRTIGNEDPGGVGQLRRPMGLGSDSSGNLFVADADRGEVLVYDQAGRFLRAIVLPRNQAAPSPKPSDVAVAADGTVYVLEEQEAKIIVYGTDGIVLSKAFSLPAIRGSSSMGGHLLLSRSEDLIIAQSHSTDPWINIFSKDGEHLWGWQGCDRVHDIPIRGSGIGRDYEDRIFFSQGWQFHAINLDGQYLFEVPISLPYSAVFNATLFDIGKDRRIYVYQQAGPTVQEGVNIIKLLEVPNVAPQCKQLRDRSRVNVARPAVSPDIAIEIQMAIQQLHVTDAAGRLDAIKKLDTLGDKAAPAIPWVIDCLADYALAGERYRETYIAHAAIQALSKIGKPAEEPLRNAVRDPNPLIRENSVKILAAKHSSVFLPVLLEALKDESSAVQRSAVDGLAALRSPEAFDPLASNLVRHLDSLVSTWDPRQDGSLSASGQEVFRALLDTDRERAFQFVLGLLAGEHTRSRTRAVLLLLTEFRDKRALGSIQDLLTASTDVAVNRDADLALSRIDPEWKKGEPGERTLQVLIQQVQGADSLFRTTASRELCSMKDPRIVDPLIRSLRFALKDLHAGHWNTPETPNGWRSWDAINCLKAHDDRWANRETAKELVPYFVEALRDERGLVREKACRFLGEVPGGFQGLLETLHDRELEVRRQAAFALGRLRDPRAVTPLIALLKDESIEFRMAVIWALGEIADPVATEPLLAIAADKSADARLRDPAARALGKSTDPNVTTFMKTLYAEGEPAYLQGLAAYHLFGRQLQAIYGKTVAIDRFDWKFKEGLQSFEYTDPSIKWNAPKEELEAYGVALLKGLSPLLGLDGSKWRLEKLSSQEYGEPTVVTLYFKHEDRVPPRIARVSLAAKAEAGQGNRETTRVRVWP